jgi:uncharacterized protein (DUF2336 family)
MESLWNLEGLSDLRLRGRVDMRPTLLRVLTDLYVQKLAHTPDEERHYTELALRLLEAVDVPTRTAVATRLARHLAPPRRIIQRLAADLPDVAAPLRGHPLLQPAAQAREPAAVKAAAAPVEPVPPQETAPVSEPIPVAEAAGAPGTGDENEWEETTPEITSDMPPAAIAPNIASELNELFFAADAEERRLILRNLEVVAPLPAGTVSITRDAGVGQRLETAALTRNREDFAQQLAQSLNIPRMQARRIAGDALGEPIVAAAKTLHMPRDVVYRILLFVNTTVGHSVERVHALAALYDEMTVQAAEHMVAIWQGLNRQEQALSQHRPLLWNDEARARARSATATVHRAPSAQRGTERRDAS